MTEQNVSSLIFALSVVVICILAAIAYCYSANNDKSE